MSKPVKLSEKNKDFFEMVYEVVKPIRPGRATNFGAIAHYLGSGPSSRMVGWAMNGAHSQPDFIPAHRVVNRNGVLTGKHHFQTETKMQELLEAEGIKVGKDTVLDFDKLFWNPATELELD